MPTFLGVGCFVLIFGGGASLWVFGGESFLSATDRQPADILVVEGWISRDGVAAAAKEFKAGHYRAVVATGTLAGESWESKRWDYAQDAADMLTRQGVPAEQVIVAPAGDPESRRTFTMANAVWHALRDRGVSPKGINVFTRGSHARRSRLIYARVSGPGVPVGSIAWIPPGFSNLPWWRSSERTKDMITESLGFLVELLVGPRRAADEPSPGDK